MIKDLLKLFKTFSGMPVDIFMVGDETPSVTLEAVLQLIPGEGEHQTFILGKERNAKKFKLVAIDHISAIDFYEVYEPSSKPTKRMGVVKPLPL